MLVRPLEEDWREAIDRVLAAHGFPASSEASRLGPLVARLSEAYNTTGTASRELLPARLAFSFARDVPKGAGAVRELVATGALEMPAGRPLRVLDVGAGLGATTAGVARALEAAGKNGEIDATWVDTDEAAMALGQELLRAKGASKIAIKARSVVAREPPRGGPPFDVILFGQVLSEMDRTTADEARVEKHATMLRAMVASRITEGGSVIVIEPALRDRSRHLHAVRDRLLAGARAAKEAVSVFAPCLHTYACPALQHEGDWCHEDLPVDLPEWLVPLARAAGLRWQGLTFAYLVLRRDGRTLASRGYPFRVISASLVTKGKREVFLCGEAKSPEGNAIGARVRVQRLDRHESPENAAWNELGRGDLVRTDPPLELPRDPKGGVGKVGPATRVDVARAKEY